MNELINRIAKVTVKRVMSQAYSPVDVRFVNDLYEWEFTFSNLTEDTTRMIRYVEDSIKVVMFESNGVTLSLLKGKADLINLEALEAIVESKIESLLNTLLGKMTFMPKLDNSGDITAAHFALHHRDIRVIFEEWLQAMAGLHKAILKDRREN